MESLRGTSIHVQFGDGAQRASVPGVLVRKVQRAVTQDGDQGTSAGQGEEAIVDLRLNIWDMFQLFAYNYNVYCINHH